jgi:hypothetical protein
METKIGTAHGFWERERKKIRSLMEDSSLFRNRVRIFLTHHIPQEPLHVTDTRWRWWHENHPSNSISTGLAPRKYHDERQVYECCYTVWQHPVEARLNSLDRYTPPGKTQIHHSPQMTVPSMKTKPNIRTVHNACHYFYNFLLFLVGWDWVHLVLPPLWAYCTITRW